MSTREKFILLDINTIKRHFKSENGVRMSERMLGKIRTIFAWVRLMGIQVISIIPAPTPKVRCEKLKYTCRKDCEILEARDTTDRPQPHDQFIFCNRCTDPFDEPRIDRVLTEIHFQYEILAIGIGKELTTTVLGLLQRGKNVTVLRDLVRFPKFHLEQVELEIKKMKNKGAKITTLEKFAEERSQEWQEKKSLIRTTMYA